MKYGKYENIQYSIFTEMVEQKQEEKVLRPKTFSETKMANHSAAVYRR